jgi:hypothetical protein
MIEVASRHSSSTDWHRYGWHPWSFIGAVGRQANQSREMKRRVRVTTDDPLTSLASGNRQLPLQALILENITCEQACSMACPALLVHRLTDPDNHPRLLAR